MSSYVEHSCPGFNLARFAILGAEPEKGNPVLLFLPCLQILSLDPSRDVRLRETKSRRMEERSGSQKWRRRHEGKGPASCAAAFIQRRHPAM
ncbi:hypothetical protein E2320_006504, partial [Naja naja]